MDISDWSAQGAKLVGSLLLSCSIEDCSGKKELKKVPQKSSYFWRKSVIKLPLWYRRGIIGIFLSFAKLFKMDQ